MAQSSHTDYYPYGMQMPGADGEMQRKQPYKFGGKEHLSAGGINLHDFGPRSLYAPAAQFASADPKCEQRPWLSPYLYCSSNPMNRVDPSGMLDWPVPPKYNGFTHRSEKNFGNDRGDHFHQGIDINFGSGKDDLGAPVLATHDGYVIIAKNYYDDNDGGGTRIKIESGDKKVATTYMHLQEMSDWIKVGVFVHEGDVIGKIGMSSSGRPDGTASHLHYELSINGTNVLSLP